MRPAPALSLATRALRQRARRCFAALRALPTTRGPGCLAELDKSWPQALAELDKSWPQALQGLPTGCGERGIVVAQTPGSPEPHGLAAQRRGLLHKRCPPRGDQAWAPGQERFKPLPIKLCRQLFGSSRLLHGAAYGRGAGEPLNASCPRTGWGGAPGMRCAREHGAAGSRRTPWRRLPRRRDEKERQQRHSASCAHPRVQTRAQARRLRLPSSRASCTNWLPLRFCS